MMVCSVEFELFDVFIGFRDLGGEEESLVPAHGPDAALEQSIPAEIFLRIIELNADQSGRGNGAGAP